MAALLITAGIVLIALNIKAALKKIIPLIKS